MSLPSATLHSKSTGSQSTIFGDSGWHHSSIDVCHLPDVTIVRKSTFNGSTSVDPSSDQERATLALPMNRLRMPTAARLTFELPYRRALFCGCSMGRPTRAPAARFAS